MTTYEKSRERVERTYHEVAARIKWLREQRGMSAADLAGQLGLHPSTISTWEAAIIRVKLSELVRVADAFGVSLEVFLADLSVSDAQPTEGVIASRERSKAKRKKNQAKKARGNSKPKAK